MGTVKNSGVRHPGQTRRVASKAPADWTALMRNAKSVREAKKITMDQVAEAVGVHTRTIAEWENGTRACPHPWDLVAYLNAIGSTILLLSQNE